MKSPLLTSADAEEALVGSILSDPTLWGLVSSLKAEVFTSSRLRAIWSHFEMKRGQVTVESTTAHLASLEAGNGKSLLDGHSPDDLLKKARPSQQLENLAALVVETAANRGFYRAVQKGLSTLDPSEEVLSAQERIDNLIEDLSKIDSGSTESGDLSKGLDELTEEISWHIANPERIKGLRLGWPDFDDGLLSGLEPGNFLVVASSPGEGKSIWVAQAARHLIMQPQDDGSTRKVAMFGVEMSGKEVLGRYVFDLARIEADKIRRGRVDHAERKRIDEAVAILRAKVVPSLFYFGPSQFGSIDDIVHLSKQLYRQEGIGAVVVDYIQRVTTRHRDSRNEEIADITSKLKSLAGQLGVPVIAVSQITRESIREGHGKPYLSAMADSSGVERDADYVIGLWRPARHIQSEKVVKQWDRVAILELLKGRFRKSSTCYLGFNGGTSSFHSLDKDWVEQLRSPAAQALLNTASHTTKTKN